MPKAVRVLLVEDEYLIRQLLAEELADAGFEVQTAEDGDQAAEIIDEDADSIDALVTDLHMPGSLNGVQVAERMRARRPEVPIVFITGRPDALHPLRLTGAEALVRKPFLPSTVVSTVDRLLGHASLGG